jgi:hypothetical protein
MSWLQPHISDVLTALLPAERATLLKLVGGIPGTLAATNGSAAITGTGTAFTQLQPGQTIVIQGTAAIVAYVTSDTTLTLTAPWAGTSASGLAAWIADSLAAIVTRIIQKIRGAVQSGGYDLDTGSAVSIPPDLMDEFVALALWRYLATIPGSASLMTKPREAANEDALAKLRDIGAQKYTPLPPEAGQQDRGGSWNAENKLIMRAHPAPTPGAQFPPAADDYANPEAPSDET